MIYNLKLAVICTCFVAVAGCATTPNRQQFAAMRGPQVERGQRNAVIDGVGWVVGIPKKIILWNSRADNHNVSPQTEMAVANYLNRNGLDTTKVRVNQYNPADEWRRLRANNRVAPGWRYTVGVLSWAGEAILPGRVFGGDSYNPFTDTINIYSDVPAIAIHEGAYAADSHTRKLPGTYGVFQNVGPFNLIHEWNATEDSLDYVARYGTGAEYAEARRTIHPLAGYRFGAGLGGNAAFLTAPIGAVAGHVSGRIGGERQTPESGQFVGLTTPIEVPQTTPTNTVPVNDPNRVRLVGHEDNGQQPTFQ